MVMLAINTCEQTCSILVRTKTKDFLVCEEMSFGQDRALPEQLREVLALAKVSVSDFCKIAVITGPGSFTAVRIGVAFARGLALVANTPTVGVNLLEVLAIQALGSGRDLGVGIKNVGRGQMAWCAIGVNGIEKEPTVNVDDKILIDVKKLAQDRPVSFAGDKNSVFALDEDVSCDMALFADRALDLDPQVHPATPWYARPPDAKLPGGIDPWRS